jgi:hypothetical protein
MKVRNTPKPLKKIEDIFKFYDFPESEIDAIVDFLSENDYLIPILIEAKTKAKEIFGEAPIILTLDRDPEEGFKELFGLIQVKLPIEKALSLLDRFDEMWFSSIYKKKSGLNFDIEIVE